MKLLRWIRFTWELSKLPPQGAAIEAQYRFRTATREEQETVRHVVISAFTLDSGFSDTLKSIRDWIEAQVDEVFRHKDVPCVVITHGTRIIGASALDVEPNSECHLLTGPCILNEYRNRGLGSALLYHSLLALREAGVERARAVTKENVPAAKFVYRKFNSQSEPAEFEPAMAGS